MVRIFFIMELHSKDPSFFFILSLFSCSSCLFKQELSLNSHFVFFSHILNLFGIDLWYFLVRKIQPFVVSKMCFPNVKCFNLVNEYFELKEFATCSFGILRLRTSTFILVLLWVCCEFFLKEAYAGPWCWTRFLSFTKETIFFPVEAFLLANAIFTSCRNFLDSFFLCFTVPSDVYWCSLSFVLSFMKSDENEPFLAKK